MKITKIFLSLVQNVNGRRQGPHYLGAMIATVVQNASKVFDIYIIIFKNAPC